MKIVSVILARGGSKEIPRKNIIKFSGQPLINWTINSSKMSNVHETWVSTDDQEIADISNQAGAKVLKRPSNLATDISPSEEALLHFADNVEFDMLVFIQPTSPLLWPQDINKGIEMMNSYSSVFSAYKEHWCPRWSMKSNPIDWDIFNRPRRQDVDETYVENGAFYITTRKNLLKSKLRYSDNIGIIEMPLWRSFQIDSQNDLELIEKLHNI